MKKEDLIGLYEILCNNIIDAPNEADCTNSENEVFIKMKELKEAIDNL